MQANSSAFASPRAKFIGAVAGVLVVVQMVALYKLCDGQMDRAHQRQAALNQQQLAVNDCLRHSVDTTIGDCMLRASATPDKASPVPRGADAVAVAAPAVLTSAMPVSFSYR